MGGLCFVAMFASAYAQKFVMTTVEVIWVLGVSSVGI